MAFNMNRTWSQAIALMRSNFQLLAVIAGVFILLPSLAITLVMPAPFAFLTMGEDPERMAEAMSGMIGPILGFGLLAFVLQMIGYGAMIALSGDERPTVGEAIRRGAKSLPTIIGAFLLFIIVYMLLAVVLSLLTALLAGLLGATTGEGAARAVSLLLFCVLVAAVLYVMVRLSLTLPVIVLEGALNPITAMRRSWRLTKPHAWAIFGFYALLAIAYVVISLLLFGVFGVVAAGLGEGTGSALFLGLVNGLVGALVALVLSGILVSMHQQLAGRPGPALGQPLE